MMTAKEVCKPLGRPGFAIDFPIEVDHFHPKDLMPLIGKTVFVQTKNGQFGFANGEEHDVTITDFSEKKLYGKVGWKKELVEIDFDDLTLLEWNETVTKRIARRSGA